MAERKPKTPEITDDEPRDPDVDVKVSPESPASRFSESAPLAGSPTSAELLAWLHQNPDEWRRLQGRFVIFDRQHGVRYDAETIGQIIDFVASQNWVTDNMLTRRIPAPED